MEVRKQLGGLAEDQLNKLVDEIDVEALVEKALAGIKKEATKLINEEIKTKLKANLIDLIDGEDDIPDVK